MKKCSFCNKTGLAAVYIVMKTNTQSEVLKDERSSRSRKRTDDTLYKRTQKSGVSRIIFLFAIIGIVAAICITLLKSSGGNLSGLFGFLGGKESSTTTADKETTTSPSEKEDIYDYDISTLPEGKKPSFLPIFPQKNRANATHRI